MNDSGSLAWQVVQTKKSTRLNRKIGSCNCFDRPEIQYFRDMSEFSKAKVKREHFVSHNDKAIKLVEELINSKDSKDITVALDKIANNNEKQVSLLNSLVLKLAHSRDNNLIEKFLKHLEGTKYWTQAFHALVLKLTCNDDWHTLDTVLHYGKKKELEPGFAGDNPIVLASEQVSHRSTTFSCKLLL